MGTCKRVYIGAISGLCRGYIGFRTGAGTWENNQARTEMLPILQGNLTCRVQTRTVPKTEASCFMNRATLGF